MPLGARNGDSIFTKMETQTGPVGDSVGDSIWRSYFIQVWSVWVGLGWLEGSRVRRSPGVPMDGARRSQERGQAH